MQYYWYHQFCEDDLWIWEEIPIPIIKQMSHLQNQESEERIQQIGTKRKHSNNANKSLYQNKRSRHNITQQSSKSLYEEGKIINNVFY